MSDDKKITVASDYQLTVKQEVHFSMRTSDWKRLRKKVETLKKQRHDFTSAGWAFVGIAVSAGFSMIAWAATYRTFSEEQTVEFAWVWPALIISFAATAILAVGAFFAAHLFKGAATATAREICDDMDEIHDPNAVDAKIENQSARAARVAAGRGFVVARGKTSVRRADGTELFPGSN